ncbi:hypothetical protein, partial [Deferrisoma palaeochoriense]
GYGSHLKATTGETLSNATNWDAQCNKCHSGHSGPVAVPLPPASWNNRTDGSGTTMNMQTQLGIDYTSHNGIYLGGTATSGSTEAEICWNCHASNGVSEWGVNNNANTGSMVYDYGSLSTPNWTTATWTSANFSYKSGAIQSTHSANFTAGTSTVSGSAYNYTETKDAVGNIRCSYCHDVHDLNKASSDTVSGQPYLRGSWKGNPYPEDGAPYGPYDRYSWTNMFGPVPRGVAQNIAGGYQIDQNNGSPASGWTLSDSAGLCTLCHGTNVDEMDWRVGEGLWVGTNGHSAAAVGGTGANKFNLYNPDVRGEGTTHTHPHMGYQSTQWAYSPNRMFGLRHAYDARTYPLSNPSLATTYITGDSDMGVTPFIWNPDAGQSAWCYQYFYWSVNFDTTAPQYPYHKFPCSKCHNPHASRLPKLMITNCLDGIHNTWDDTFSVDPDWTSGKTYVGSSYVDFDWSTSGLMSASVQAAGKNRELFYARSAQNCHRFVDADEDNVMDAGDEPGWNKVTPW